jgi:hypothetical protein
MAFQLKSGHKLVDFFKNAGKKIKSVGDNVEKFKAKRRADDIAKNQKKGLSKAEWNSDTSTPYEVGKTSFEVRKEKEARMRRTGKSMFELQKIDAAARARRAKNKKNKQDPSSGGPEMNENMA